MKRPRTEPATDAERKKLALELALARLNAREYASGEMKAYLGRKGIPQEIVDETVSELQRQELIDDRRYARIVVRHQALRGKGSRYIQNKLREKGVLMETSEVSRLLQELSPRSELESAMEIVERRYPDFREGQKEANRAFQALIRRGFSFEVARKAVFSRT